ncbi:oligosaccharide flippase family protein [Pedobacter sp. BS3]|uniref:lipopolysaccharide biosynthesis protein n=1 Tax=Pedobacter sp. BS3 TaxID=2567937 RepID=UPI0011EE7D7D|nr:polysaccharide biosynthesis C-terminal domain-containing protein [Pedobacter sp. BS3]TZF83199.1 oligosaccharide flippase family protein [Pedobacter sp. BS3]
MSSIKKFAGQTAIYGVSTVISRVLNFILTPLFVRVYPPKIYSIFTYMYSWASLLNAVLAFGMETTFFRYLNKPGNNKAKVYGNTFIIIAVIAFTFLLATYFFAPNIASWLQKGEVQPDHVLYVKYFIWILVVDALAVIPFAKVRADGRPLRFGMIKLINIFTFVGGNLFFLFVIPYIIKHHLIGADSLASWYKPVWVGYVFISNLIASVITLLMLLPELLQLKFDFSSALVVDMLSYSFPVLVANISFIINENIDKMMMPKLLPLSQQQDVGIYGACCKIAVFLSIFVQAFRLGAEPFFFSHAKNKNAGETYARIMNYFIIMICIIFLGLVANIEILKYFIKGKNATDQLLYWSGIPVVPILLFGYVCLGIYMNLSIWYKLSDQTRYGLYISGVGAVLTIVLNMMLIPKYSYMAAAWVSLAAYAVMMILSYILGQKKYPIPYRLKKNLAYIISAIVLVFLSFQVFGRNLVIGNILLMIYIIGTLYAERKELTALLKK